MIKASGGGLPSQGKEQREENKTRPLQVPPAAQGTYM